MSEQLTLPFLPDVDRQVAEARELETQRRKRANALARIR